MKLVGYLSEYSLPEIFSFLDEGTRTGLLTLSPESNLSTPTANSQNLWFHNGRIIAVTTGNNGLELLTKIEQRKFINPQSIERTKMILDRLSQPLGLYLKSQGLIDAGQLKLLFNSQTIVPICKLFEPDRIRFQFEPKQAPPHAELTGLSLTARELGFLGLRLLKNWSGLSNKLPDPSYAIYPCGAQLAQIELNRHEQQLLKLADGKTNLTQLAIKMSLSIEEILQISFRLITFRLVREISTESIQSIDSELALPLLAPGSSNSPISISFLGGLKKFLKQRVTNNI